MHIAVRFCPDTTLSLFYSIIPQGFDYEELLLGPRDLLRDQNGQTKDIKQAFRLWVLGYLFQRSKLIIYSYQNNTVLLVFLVFLECDCVIVYECNAKRHLFCVSKNSSV